MKHDRLLYKVKCLVHLSSDLTGSSSCSRPHSSEPVFSVESKLLPWADRPRRLRASRLRPCPSQGLPLILPLLRPPDCPSYGCALVPGLLLAFPLHSVHPKATAPQAWPSSTFSLPPFQALLPPMLSTPNTSSPCQGPSLCAGTRGFQKPIVVDVSCRVELTYEAGSVPFLFRISKRRLTFTHGPGLASMSHQPGNA